MTVPLRIGFIPLVDAAALIVAVDKGFAKAEGLDVSLVREVSWSNVRDKLNLGLFEAAHLLAPVAIASSLGKLMKDKGAQKYIARILIVFVLVVLPGRAGPCGPAPPQSRTSGFPAYGSSE